MSVSARSYPVLLVALLALFAGRSQAQSTTVDQHSLRGTKFNALIVGPDYTVQQQVRAGSSGTLTGLELMSSGNAGTSIHVRLRRGAAISVQPVLWETTYVHQGLLGFDTPFFDVSSAGIQLQAGELFVIEVEQPANNTGLAASFANPPCYPEPIVPAAPALPTLRLVFRTWMSEPAPGTIYCAPGASSVYAPARIWAQGSTSIAADDLVLYAGPMPDVIALDIVGTQATQVPFGNGNLCVTGLLARLPAQVPYCGTLVSPLNLSQLPPAAVVPGATLHMQAWFRDPFGGGAGTFSLSDGYSVTLTP